MLEVEAEVPEQLMGVDEARSAGSLQLLKGRVTPATHRTLETEVHAQRVERVAAWAERDPMPESPEAEGSPEDIPF